MRGGTVLSLLWLAVEGVVGGEILLMVVVVADGDGDGSEENCAWWWC